MQVMHGTMSVMIKDKYSAVWVSHSSIGDYLKCPRAYYLNNVYRDPKTNNKITLMQPPLALGQVVHGVIEEISLLPAQDRFLVPLIERFEKLWATVGGRRGGFSSSEEENKYKARGLQMVTNIHNHPGPLSRKAVKIHQNLPYFWLSEEDGIILCGKIDWLEYDEKTDTVKIIDFKTGKSDEDPDSLQLPIYYLLTLNCQKRNISGGAYWYIERDEMPLSVELPDKEKARETVLEIAKKIALARKLEHFKCKQKDGCFACRPLEKIIRGEAEFVGVNDFRQDVYVLKINPVQFNPIT